MQSPRAPASTLISQAFLPAARQASVLLASLAMVSAIVILDIRTGKEISLSLLYLAPIVVAAWSCGAWAGTAVAAAGSLAWFLWDPGENARLEAVPLWNLAARMGVFALVAGAIGTLRSSIRRERRAAEELKTFNERLDRQVKERTESLRRAVQEMEVFTYTMAHDLRAPLRAIHGFADVLCKDYGANMPPEAQDFCDRITAASRKMDELVLDLLDYGRLIHAPVATAPVELEPLCRAVLADVEARMRDVKAESRVESPLPKASADPVLLQSALREVVDNALDFARPGVPPRLCIRGSSAGGRAVLEIEDNGVGIPSGHLHRIFEPFQQLAPPSDDGGTGMGLALARKAVERMNGTIEARSEPGRGSVFRISLPAANPGT